MPCCLACKRWQLWSRHGFSPGRARVSSQKPPISSACRQTLIERCLLAFGRDVIPKCHAKMSLQNAIGKCHPRMSSQKCHPNVIPKCHLKMSSQSVIPKYHPKMSCQNDIPVHDTPIDMSSSCHHSWRVEGDALTKLGRTTMLKLAFVR